LPSSTKSYVEENIDTALRHVERRTVEVITDRARSDRKCSRIKVFF